MKDISTPVPPHEVRSVIKTSLEKAALVNYERLSEEARIEAERDNPQGGTRKRIFFLRKTKYFSEDFWEIKNIFQRIFEKKKYFSQAF